MDVFIENKVIDTVSVKTLVMNEYNLIEDAFNNSINVQNIRTKAHFEKKIKKLEAENDLASIECIYFQNSTFSDLPLWLAKHFEHVKYLHAVNCGIRRVSHEALAAFTKLEGLFLEGNNILEFPYRQLIFFSKLRVCSFGKESRVAENCKIFLGKWGVQESAFKALLNGKFKPLMEANEEQAIDLPQITSKMLAEAREKLEKENEKENTEKPDHEHSQEAKEVRLQVLPSLYKAAYALESLKDFVIIADSTTIKVHRVVLASHSRLMLELFEKNPEVRKLDLTDLKESSVHLCVDFIYNENFRLNDDWTPMTLFPLMVAAEKIGIERLCELVENELSKLMNPEMAVEIFKRLKSESLKKSAFEYIRKLFPDKSLCTSLMKRSTVIVRMMNIRDRIDDLERKAIETDLLLEFAGKELDNIIDNCCAGEAPGHYSQTQKPGFSDYQNLREIQKAEEEKMMEEMEKIAHSSEKSNDESTDDDYCAVSEISKNDSVATEDSFAKRIAHNEEIGFISGDMEVPDDFEFNEEEFTEDVEEVVPKRVMVCLAVDEDDEVEDIPAAAATQPAIDVEKPDEIVPVIEIIPAQPDESSKIIEAPAPEESEVVPVETDESFEITDAPTSEDDQVESENSFEITEAPSAEEVQAESENSFEITDTPAPEDSEVQATQPADLATEIAAPEEAEIVVAEPAKERSFDIEIINIPVKQQVFDLSAYF